MAASGTPSVWQELQDWNFWLSPPLAQRIEANPLGRPLVTSFEVDFQVQLQAAVAAFYAIACGRRCFVLDTTRFDAEHTVETALDLLKEAGVQAVGPSRRF